MAKICRSANTNDLAFRDTDVETLPNLLGASRNRQSLSPMLSKQHNVKQMSLPSSGQSCMKDENQMSLPNSAGSRMKVSPPCVQHSNTWPRAESDELGDTEQVQAFVQEIRRSSILHMLAQWSPCVPTVVVTKASKEKTLMDWMYKNAAMSTQKFKKTTTEKGNGIHQALQETSEEPLFMDSSWNGFLSTTSDAAFVFGY